MPLGSTSPSPHNRSGVRALHRSHLDPLQPTVPRPPLIIVNPASAGGSTGRRWGAIAGAFRAHFGRFEAVHTGASGDARDIARREAGDGRLLVACGGDGTIAEVAGGILESGNDAELGTLPAGTGGDFRRSIGIPTRAEDAAAALRDGVTRRIDAARLTTRALDGQPVTRWFINVASFGASSAVVRRVADDGVRAIPSLAGRLLGGPARIALAAARSAVTLEAPMIEIGIDDGRPFCTPLANLCIANARYFGGGMRIAPEAELDDGLLDIVTVGDVGRMTFIRSVPRLYAGTHLGIRGVSLLRAKRITARLADQGAEPMAVEADGELAGTLPLRVEIVGRALRVRFGGEGIKG